MHVLFVCTGNACRSPVGERLLSAWVQQADAGTIRVASAGTRAINGQRMDAASAQALVELGGDPSGFTSRQLDAAAVGGAALVLTMTRAHRRAVLSVAPQALRRTFTLTEAAALLPLADLSGLADMPLESRAAFLATRLAGARAQRRDSDADDVRDPVGQPIGIHREVAGQIATALRAVANALLRPQELVLAPAESGRPRPRSADLGPADVESLNARSLGATPDEDETTEPRRLRRRAPLMAVGLIVIAAATAALLTRPLLGPGATATADRASTDAVATTTAPPANAPTIVLPADPALLILGDAETDAVGADPQSAGWAYQTAVALGWRTVVAGSPGSGYTTSTGINPRTFAQRVTELAGAGTIVPDVLVLQGGDLDADADPAAVSDGVQAAVSAGQAAWPGVHVVVLGIVSPRPVANDLAAVNEAEHRAADAAGVAFIDPMTNDWFTLEDSYRYTAPDGVHLNNPGQAAVAARFLAAFRAMVIVP